MRLKECIQFINIFFTSSASSSMLMIAYVSSSFPKEVQKRQENNYPSPHDDSWSTRVSKAEKGRGGGAGMEIEDENEKEGGQIARERRKHGDASFSVGA